MKISRLDLDGTGSPTGLVTRILKIEKDLEIPVPIEKLAQQLDIQRIQPLETEEKNTPRENVLACRRLVAVQRFSAQETKIRASNQRWPRPENGFGKRPGGGSDRRELSATVRALSTCFGAAETS